jgi:hypothetical protein
VNELRTIFACDVEVGVAVLGRDRYTGRYRETESIAAQQFVVGFHCAFAEAENVDCLGVLHRVLRVPI